MSLCLIVLYLNILPSNSFASEYFSEETEGEFKGYDLSAMEKILFDDKDEAFVIDYIKDHANTEEKRPIIDENAENILPSLHFQQSNYLKDDFRMHPPPSKSKSPNGRKKVELTEIEKNEIIRIHTAGPEGLEFKKLKIRDRKTWQRMFDDDFSQDECIKKMLNLKKKRLINKLYRARPAEIKRRKNTAQNQM